MSNTEKSCILRHRCVLCKASRITIKKIYSPSISGFTLNLDPHLRIPNWAIFKPMYLLTTSFCQPICKLQIFYFHKFWLQSSCLLHISTGQSLFSFSSVFLKQQHFKNNKKVQSLSLWINFIILNLYTHEICEYPFSL